MNRMLVTYDISNDDRREECRKTIEKYKCHEVAESTYAILTNKTTSEVRDQLKEYVKKGDRLFVCIFDDYAGQNTGVQKWLEKVI